MDQLFADAAMESNKGLRPDIDALPGGVLAGLPDRMQHRYTVNFARKFTVTMAVVTSRLSSGWVRLGCVAEELAVRLLLDETEQWVVMAADPGIPEDWRDFAEDNLLEDTDVDLLYCPELDGIEDEGAGPPDLGLARMDFDAWFIPFRPGEGAPRPTCSASGVAASHVGRRPRRGRRHRLSWSSPEPPGRRPA